MEFATPYKVPSLSLYRYSFVQFRREMSNFIAKADLFEKSAFAMSLFSFLRPWPDEVRNRNDKVNAENECPYFQGGG